MTCKTCSGQGRWDDIPCTACGGTGGDEPVVTPLRTRAIDAVTRETCPGFPAVCWACRDTAERAVDALLAAGLLHDPTDEARAQHVLDAILVSRGWALDDVEYAKALAFARDALNLPPRDDEARIERAARAIHERHFPRTPWEDSRDDARDYCRDEARAALAAADQEEKP